MLLYSQYEPLEETANFAHTQRHTSPRVTLKAVRLLDVGWSSMFWGASSGGRWAAHKMVNRA